MAFPLEIGQLSSLQTLTLISNQLTDLPSEIDQLSSLQNLDVWGNQLAVLPPEIGQLSSLKTLVLSSNQLTALPSEIGQLSSLQTLDLWDNQLADLPPEIGKLSGLQIFDLRYNRLTNLPPEIGQLSGLQALNLMGNQLTDLPPEVSQLSSLQGLFLHGNETLSLPPEILGPSWAESVVGMATPADPEVILDYLFRLQKEPPRPLHEAKILIVGQGAVGKTSLVNRLVNDRFNPDEPQTDGIEILHWQVDTQKSAEGETVGLRIWDFGGQEIMHATHQFFLTKRSLYLLVVEARKGDDGSQISHWLRIIRSFGEDSPILVVINKVEGNSAPDLDETSLLNQHPSIRGFFSISCRDGTGIEELRTAITRELESLEHVYSPLPASYFEVKERLEAMTGEADYVEVDKYRSLAAAQGIEEAAEQNRLLRFLHDLGSVLHYGDPEGLYRLDETKILNPEWVTSGVYKILTDPQLKKNQGVLKHGDLDRILTAEEGYPKSARYFILGMMRRFELCFDFRDGDAIVLVTQLLPRNSPEFPWPSVDCLEFEIHYSYLPPGLLPRFIVKSHDHLTEHPTYWRSGVLLKLGKNRVLIRGDGNQRRLYISVRGPRQGRRTALATARNILRSIHLSIPGLGVQEHVPLPDEPELTVEYDHLLLLEEEGELTFWPPRAKRKYSVQQLLDGVETRGDRAKRQFGQGNKIYIERLNMSKKEFHSHGVAIQGDGQYVHDVQVQQDYQQVSGLDLKIIDEDLSHISLLPFKHVIANGTYFIDTDDT